MRLFKVLYQDTSIGHLGETYETKDYPYNTCTEVRVALEEMGCKIIDIVDSVTYTQMRAA